MSNPDPAVFADGLMDNSAISATDWSKQILDAFFGVGWNSITASPGVDESSVSMIFDILWSINIAAMSVGSVILAWSFIMGTVGTAHEGRILGRQTIWGPIRSGIAVALMAPFAKGLCTLQVLILLLIAGSINFANVIWKSGLDFMEMNNGQVVLEIPEDIKKNTEKIAYGALKSLSIQNFYKHVLNKSCKIGIETENLEFKRISEHNGNGFWRFSFKLPEMDGMEQDDLGSIVVYSVSENSAVGKKRKEGVKKLIQDLESYAGKITSAITDKISSPSNETISAYKNAIETYNQGMLPHLKEIVKSNKPEFDQELKSFVNSAKLSGWLSAGSYYWTISGYAEQNQKVLNNFPVYYEPDTKKISKYANKQFDALQDRLEKVKSADVLATQIQKARNGKEMGSVHRFFNKIFYDLYGGRRIDTITNLLSKGDPIGNLTSLGHEMIATSSVMLATGITLRAASGAVTKAAKKTWLGRLANLVSGIGDMIEAATEGVIDGVWPFFVTVVMFIFFNGIMLAYYLPFVPFIFWWFAVVGWILLVIEALFAAPLWAAAHAIPEGKGLAGAHAKPGYKMLLGVLIRPPLMVAGFLVAIVLIIQIGKIMGEAFKLSFGTGVAANHVVGPVGILVLTILLSGFLIVISQKIFGIVTHLPGAVMKWIGGESRNLGEHNDLQQTRAGLSGVLAKGEQDMKSRIAQDSGSKGSKQKTV